MGKMIDGQWKEIEKPGKELEKEEWWETDLRGRMNIRIETWSEEEEARQKARREETDEVIVYLDGSRKEEGEGVGVCRMWQDGDRGGLKWGKNYSMGKRMEIMDMKMVGIKKAMEWGLSECRNEGIKFLTVRVDSQEAMRRCQERRRGGGEMMVAEIRKLWREGERRGMTTRLEWVKGDAKVWGNE